MRRLGIAVLAIGLLAGCGADSVTGAEDQGTDAWVTCEKFVKRQIEIRDVDFGGRDATTIKGNGEGPYTVTSTFATGGKPVDYTCKVRHDAAAEQWKLVDLTTGW